MDQNTKQRLVGIAVIFALAVIFLPMVLDGSGVQKKNLKVEIPPQPVIPKRADFSEKIIELETRTKAIPDLEARFVDENTGNTDNRVNRGDAESDTTEKTETLAESTGESEEVGEQQAVERPGGDSWVLQVGSFQDRSKATAQRDKLRKSNIAAVFIEQFNANNQASYRVRLGPFPDREKSRIAQNKIKAKYNIDGLIMKYER